MTKVLAYTQPHNAARLYDELVTAVPVLAPSDGYANLLLSSDGANALQLTVPDATDPLLIDPVLAAHDPTPDPPPVIDFAGSQSVDAKVITTDETALEVFRFPTQPKHVYRATLRMAAIDAGSGATRDSEVRLVFKRLAATLSQVGSTVVLSNCQDTATAPWAILPTVDGTDLVISVRGATGRTVDWLMTGDIGRFAPEGLD